jgi:hypothetical protein
LPNLSTPWSRPRWPRCRWHPPRPRTRRTKLIGGSWIVSVEPAPPRHRRASRPSRRPPRRDLPLPDVHRRHAPRPYAGRPVPRARCSLGPVRSAIKYLATIKWTQLSLVFRNFPDREWRSKDGISTSVDLTAGPPEPMFATTAGLRIPRQQLRNFP